ncbi:uncharacterized protein L969DRAFT_93040 [Mixia osmundae IAM 14324]|uniref:Uncharacterized protein n=1 Tax=Mixia osmundae (strain CBS 9802 / IAM 14324 / JCM 22182 / KY 12970) TaxID=764103 RepID=G7E6A2_MIXOS|nr:uncharacterized protein L969DRAFT_93040 [Mixia osmundae IAM 14324]KEI40481.1 hypothetical protein L969DRAFT_93040 [Mixia osmundae IAM 14324]GAA98362.1 hypothetical protein E5Q_05048 [Mixia osmundae IAM 14324]
MSLNFAPYQEPPSSTRSAGALSSSGQSQDRTLPAASLSSSRTQGSGPSASQVRASPWLASSSSSPSAQDQARSSSSYQAGASVGQINPTSFGSASSAHRAGFSDSSSSARAAEAGLAPLGPDAFETTLGLRTDVEAAMTYLLGPISGLIILMTEHKNDYVRFHAWQSSLLGFAAAFLHLILAWSSFFEVLLLILDIIALTSLAVKAYRDAEILERYTLPYIGPLANQWVDEE